MAVLALACLLTNCGSTSIPPPVRFRDQESAGSVQIAVQTVAPFEEYIATLEPKFALTTDQALTAALAQTQTEDSQQIRELLGVLSVMQQQAAASKGGASGGGTTGASTTPATTATSTCPNVNVACSAAPASTTTGASSGTSSGGSSGGGGSASTTIAAPAKVDSALGALALPAGNVDFDQALRFRAAAALLQEVALLNHYVRDAAVQSGERPYIVRLLVTVIPSARNEPYDAYTTISFFEDDRSLLIQPLRSFPYQGIKSGNAPHPSREAQDMVKNLEERFEHGGCGGRPINVIPLLVTDDLESSLHSNAFQTIRDLALTAQAIFGTTGIGAGARAHAEDLDRTLNRNLNSIFTIGRAAPNAITARFGAAFNNGRYVTVPRTYSVSLLLLIPTGAKYLPGDDIAGEMIPCPSLNYVAHSRMRDAGSGKYIDIDSMWAQRDLTGRVIDVLRLDARSFDFAMALLDTATAADYGAFSATYRKIFANASSATIQDAYTKVIAISQASGRGEGKFAVSLNDARLPAIGKESTSLFDDGKTLQMTIGGGRNLLPDRLDATVKVQYPSPDGWVILKKAVVDVTPDGRTAHFSFPSLASATDKKGGVAYAEVRYAPGLRAWQSSYNEEWYPTELVNDAGADDETKCCARLTVQFGQTVAHQVCLARAEGTIHPDELPVGYFKAPSPPAAKPPFTMTLPSHRILADRDGSGELMIELRSTDQQHPSQVHFVVSDGGFVAGVTPLATIAGADHIGSDGAYVLQLKDLVPKTQVIVRAFVLDNGKEASSITDKADVVLKEEPPKKTATQEKP